MSLVKKYGANIAIFLCLQQIFPLKIVYLHALIKWKNYMDFLTDEKLVIVGAAGMIGSNMAAIAAILRLTPNICLYDVYEPGNNGVLLEMQHSAFPRMRFTATTDPKEAFTGAKYIISSGGAPRKEGMTREDLLKGNCEIAANLGDNIRKYCPEVKHVFIIFNPADVTALTVLIHSGLRPCRVSSLAALDSTRLQTNLAKEFGVRQSDVENAYTYGGHGESMAVFMSQATICGTPIASMGLSKERMEAIKQETIQGGAQIIKLRGRSSIQSPAYLSVKAIEGAIKGGAPFPWPSGTYVDTHEYSHVFMAMPTYMDATGIHYYMPEGNKEEMADLKASYNHLVEMRETIIKLGIIPPVEEWHKMNPYLWNRRLPHMKPEK